MADDATYSFEAPLWEWDGKASWHFVSVPNDIADEIDDRFGSTAVGFGSIRVEVQIGDTVWKTSLFPSKEEATYVLPIKKAVRVAQHLDLGSVAAVTITIDRSDPAIS